MTETEGNLSGLVNDPFAINSTANAATANVAATAEVRYVDASGLTVLLNGGASVDAVSAQNMTTVDAVSLGHTANASPTTAIRSVTLYAL